MTPCWAAIYVAGLAGWAFAQHVHLANACVIPSQATYTRLACGSHGIPDSTVEGVQPYKVGTSASLPSVLPAPHRMCIISTGVK